MNLLHRDKAAATAISEKLKIFAQPQRLMILSFLLSGEFTVSEIDEATCIGQPALSQQLAALRGAALVDTRREAKQIFYRLADGQVGDCIRMIDEMFSGNGLHVRPKEAPRQSRAAPPITAPSLGAASFAKVVRSA